MSLMWMIIRSSSINPLYLYCPSHGFLVMWYKDIHCDVLQYVAQTDAWQKHMHLVWEKHTESHFAPCPLTFGYTMNQSNRWHDASCKPDVFDLFVKLSWKCLTLSECTGNCCFFSCFFSLWIVSLQPQIYKHCYSSSANVVFLMPKCSRLWNVFCWDFTALASFDVAALLR